MIQIEKFAPKQATGAGECLDHHTSKLAIVAGSGSLPGVVAEAALAAGQAVHILGLDGYADAALTRFAFTSVRMGEIGKLLRVIRQEGCGELVIIGSVKRPDMGKLHFDAGALINLPLLLRLMIGGDDSMLTRVVQFFERKGLVVRGAHEVAPELVAGAGALGRHRPGRRDQADIALGMAVTQQLGDLDVGQAAVVARGHVLAVEAAEGTDQMLTRCGGLRQWGRHRSRRRMGALVKRPKPRQELRIDMPAIGPHTVRLAAEAGLAGIAIEAGHVLIADRGEAVRLADEAGLFLVGMPGAAGGRPA